MNLQKLKNANGNPDLSDWLKPTLFMENVSNMLWFFKPQETIIMANGYKMTYIFNNNQQGSEPILLLATLN